MKPRLPFKVLGHLTLSKIQMIREAIKLGWKSKKLENMAYVFETDGVQYIIHVERGTIYGKAGASAKPEGVRVYRPSA